MGVCFTEALVFGGEDIDVGAGAPGGVGEEIDVGGGKEVEGFGSCDLDASVSGEWKRLRVIVTWQRTLARTS